MAIDLTSFEPSVRAHKVDWEALALRWTVRPISRAKTGAQFESADWLVEIDVWETGDMDLIAARIADGWIVDKHYDLEAGSQLDVVFVEVIALVRDGAVPAGASTWFRRN